LLGGVSELAEIATLRAGDHGIQLVGNYDPDCDQGKFLHLPVLHDLAEVSEYDACLLTELQAASARYVALLDVIPQDRLIVPSLLRSSL